MKVSIPKNESKTNRLMLAVDKMQRLCSRWLTNDEQQLCIKAIELNGTNADAATLWLLHTDFGFTKDQLLEFIRKYCENYKHLDNSIQTSIEYIPEIQKLKDIGVDLVTFYEEAGL